MIRLRSLKSTNRDDIRADLLPSDASVGGKLERMRVANTFCSFNRSLGPVHFEFWHHIDIKAAQSRPARITKRARAPKNGPVSLNRFRQDHLYYNQWLGL